MKRDIFILFAVAPIAIAAYLWIFLSMLGEALSSYLKSRDKKTPSRV